MSTLSFNIDVQLELCPVCLEGRRWKLFEETQRLGRVISALRGTVTRTKRLTKGRA